MACPGAVHSGEADTADDRDANAAETGFATVVSKA